MSAIYGHRWTSGFGESAEDEGGKLTIVGDTWQRGLSGIPETLIGSGLDRCLTSADPWPPTLPEFRARCIGIPDFALVMETVDPGSLTIYGHAPTECDDFTAIVRKRIDWSLYRSAKIEAAERIVRRAYDTAREDVMSAGSIPPQPPRLAPPPPPPPRTPEQIAAARVAGEEAIAKLNAMLYPQPRDDGIEA